MTPSDAAQAEMLAALNQAVVRSAQLAATLAIEQEINATLTQERDALKAKLAEIEKSK